MWEPRVEFMVLEDPLEKEMATHSSMIFLPGESHGWKSLVGYSQWDCKESDTTKQLSEVYHALTEYVQENGPA